MPALNSAALATWCQREQWRWLNSDNKQIHAPRMIRLLREDMDGVEEIISRPLPETVDKMDFTTYADECREALENDLEIRTGDQIYYVELQNAAGQRLVAKPFTARGSMKRSRIIPENEPSVIVATVKSQNTQILELHDRALEYQDRHLKMTQLLSGGLKDEIARLQARNDHLERELGAADQVKEKLLDRTHQQKLEEMREKSRIKRDENMFGQLMPFLGPVAGRIMAGLMGDDPEALSKTADDLSFISWFKTLEPQQMLRLHEAIPTLGLTPPQNLFLMGMLEKMADLWQPPDGEEKE